MAHQRPSPLLLSSLVVFVVVSIAAANAPRPPKQPQPLTFVPVASAAASCAGFNLTAVSFGGLQPNEQKYLIAGPSIASWANDATTLSCSGAATVAPPTPNNATLRSLLFHTQSRSWLLLTIAGLYRARDVSTVQPLNFSLVPESSFGTTKAESTAWTCMAQSKLGDVVALGSDTSGGWLRYLFNDDPTLSTWQPADLRFNNGTLFSIDYGVDFFYAAGQEPSGQLPQALISGAGTVWRNSSSEWRSSDSSTCNSIVSVAYGNGVWLALCWQQSSGVAKKQLWVSKDATRHFDRVYPKGVDESQIDSVTYQNNIFFAIGTKTLASSANTYEWLVASLPVGTATIRAVGYSYRDDRYVAVGDHGTVLYSDGATARAGDARLQHKQIEHS